MCLQTAGVLAATPLPSPFSFPTPSPLGCARCQTLFALLLSLVQPTSTSSCKHAPDPPCCCPSPPPPPPTHIHRRRRRRLTPCWRRTCPPWSSWAWGVTTWPPWSPRSWWRAGWTPPLWRSTWQPSRWVGGVPRRGGAPAGGPDRWSSVQGSAATAATAAAPARKFVVHPGSRATP